MVGKVPASKITGVVEPKQISASAIGEIIGTLSGGGSYCSALTSSDQYGKMSYHWQSNATANNRRLKPWLDPTNSGVTSISGTYAPCTSTSTVDAGLIDGATAMSYSNAPEELAKQIGMKSRGL